MSGTAAIVGAGVIGGGWAARFLLMGWDVRVFDPDPDAVRRVEAMLDNARRSLPGLSEVALPDEGRLSFHDSVASAVAGAVWIQESVPERLDLKARVVAGVQAACDPDAVIGSSTARFGPGGLQAGAARPGQIVVARPCNPVYLLPLVEVAGSAANATPLIDRACAHLSSVGMAPLRLRGENDGHVTDRLLGAVWREALGLIRDGIATTGEIDDAIRMGIGLNWAQMGMFETLRMAGGEAGIRHAIAQTGARHQGAGELTEDLIDTVASQSDAQSGMHAFRELERIRDGNLVAMLRALKARDWGAGTVLRAQDARIAPPPVDIAGPIATLARAVPLDWTDYNGHMNEARYLHAFGDATDRFMEILGCDADYIASGASYFTAETHIRHIDEVLAGARIRVETLCLKGEGSKLHLFHRMFEGDRLLATGEHFLLHVSLATRRPSLPSDAVAARLGEIAAAHGVLERPDGIGRAVGRK